MANSEVKKYTITEPLLNTSCALGEGPFWEENTNTLRFVDIIKAKLFFVDLTKGEQSLKEHQLDHSIGITADIEGNDDEIVFGGKIKSKDEESRTAVISIGATFEGKRIFGHRATATVQLG